MSAAVIALTFTLLIYLFYRILRRLDRLMSGRRRTENPCRAKGEQFMESASRIVYMEESRKE